LQRVLELVEKSPRCLRRVDVRPGDDLHQGRAGAVEIYQGIGRAGNPATFAAMDVLGCIFLLVHPLDPDSVCLAVYCYMKLPIHRERLIILRDLVTLWQVGIKIILAVEDALFRDRAFHRQRYPGQVTNSLAVHHRQRPRVRQAYRADARVGPAAELHAAAAEHLALCRELHVDLKSDYRFVFHLVLPLDER